MTHHASFGSIVVVTTFHIAYFVSNILYVVISIIKIRKKKNLLVAQTMCHASFEPVIVIAGFYVMYIIYRL